VLDAGPMPKPVDKSRKNFVNKEDFLGLGRKRSEFILKQSDLTFPDYDLLLGFGDCGQHEVH
jgi:hypothetical protein